MAKKTDSTEVEEIILRTDITNRKKIQTAEGWRRTMQKMREAKRNKASSKAK